MRKTAIALTVPAVLLLTAAPAMATDSEEIECRTVETELIDRPDSAVGGGTWALDHITRTLEVCEVAEGNEGRSWYTAELTDVGTFETLSLDHTPNGAPQELPAGITGEISGGASFEIVGAADFEHFNADDIDEKTFTGEGPRGTSDWLRPMFGKNAEETTEVYAATWSWTYTTCDEEWVNQSDALGGNTGDITKVAECPEPKPTETETPDPDPTQTQEPKPEPTETSDPTPDETTKPVSTEQLPKTGATAQWLALGGIIAIVVGVFAMIAARRSRG